MSCKQAEDVCQHCLEKVQTSTEDAPPPKRAPTTQKEYSPREKTMTARQKRNSILVDSSFLVAGGALFYLNGKYFFKLAAMVFDSILDTIGTRTRKE